ncbi:MAG: isoprenylcysteine carboxylmethyltransferase family protein [Nanoarchaeota archaeon]|nr:isoprenylcysteine carboxylmethyltransferase family protein [Nanoarchaeota archaeon]
MINLILTILVYWFYVHNLVRLLGFAEMERLRKMGSKFFLLEALIMSVWIFLLLQVNRYLFAHRLFSPPFLLQALGVACMFLGSFIWSWAIKVLGLRVATVTSEITNKKFELKTSGPYSFVRHPIYLGEWIVGLGVFFVTGYTIFLLSLVVSLPLFHLIMNFEEKALKIKFGEDYERYAKNTPRFLPLRSSIKGKRAKFKELV